MTPLIARVASAAPPTTSATGNCTSANAINANPIASASGSPPNDPIPRMTNTTPTPPMAAKIRKKEIVMRNRDAIDMDP